MIPFENPLPDKSKAATTVAAAAYKIAIKMNTQKQTYPRGSLYKLQQMVFLIGVPPFVRFQP